MHIATLNDAQHAEFLALVDAEIRPGRAESHAWDDFPLILDRANLAWTLGIVADDGRLAAGLACLTRQFETSCGRIPIAGIGSVVTRPEFRRRGYSSALQNEMLARLKRNNVPLAVLWTDKPEIYAGRGYVPAGWEQHLDLRTADLPGDLPPGFEMRPYRDADAEAVGRLYRRHPLRTVRLPGEDARLYGMPGTTGRVACGDDGTVVAAVFCGKGADFPGYVPEWSGPVGLVAPLLIQVRDEGLAQLALAPAGSDALVNHLVKAGAGWSAHPSGCWAVLQPDQLSRYLQAAGHGSAADPADPRSVLGCVGEDGLPAPGPLAVAVWGFDSV